MVAHDRQPEAAVKQNVALYNTAQQTTAQQNITQQTSHHRARFPWGWLGGVLALGLGWQGIAAIAASPNPVEPSAPLNPSSPAAVAAVMAEAAPVSPLADGVYLYGESPEPDQIGRAYLVLEVTQGSAIGAFYMPASEFDCTYGRFQADQLALTVIDSYEQGRHPYAIALTAASPIAAQPDQATGLNLEGFYPIAAVSENDQRILDTCKVRYPVSERQP